MIKRTVLLLASICFAGSVIAQMNPMEPIPADKEVRTGRLENGLTYYIRHNEKPKGQADFYILHNVGAIQEEDSQQGLAHFLEHMAFNGSKNLPGKQMIEYLENIGVKFGANLNAFTSWDQTQYMIQDVPTVRKGTIDSAMLVLHDWSHFIALEPEEIDSERGVIQEELRTRDGAQWRSTINLIKALGKGTLYADRNIIGHLEGLKSFEHKELVDFYNKWYRPDYQAVVVVGDIDVDYVEGHLKELMSDIPAPAADAAVKAEIVVPDNEVPIVSIYTDPEMQGSRIQLFMKYGAIPNQINGTVYGRMIGMIQGFISTMENARIEEIAMQPDAPFLAGGMDVGSAGVIPTLESATFVAITQDGKIARGLEALYTEVEKVRRHGFTQSEFERAQEDLMRRAERQYANRNDRTNGEYVQIYLQNYQKNTPMADAKTQWQLDSLLIKSLNVDAVNQFAQQVMTPKNQVLVITGPKKEGVVTPTEDEVLAIREKVLASEVEAYAEDVVKEPLIAEDVILAGSPVKKSVANEAMGTTEWTLKNGIKVVVKPTTYKADEVIIRAKAEGGMSMLTNEMYHMGEMLGLVQSMSGVGKFSATELKKQLAGKSAGVGLGVGQHSATVEGMGSPKDLETLMQLLWLNFTNPRFDESDYNNLITMVRSQLENAESNPDFVMQKRFMEEAYGNHPRMQMVTAEMLDNLKFEMLPTVHNKIYGNAGSFIFSIVGNVDLETLKPLVEKYIGSLPVAGKPSKAVEDNIYPVKGGHECKFNVKMQQPKVSVHYLFSGDMATTLKNKAAMSFLSQALNARYLKSIREEKGGTYGVHVSQATSNIPKQTYTMEIQFDTNDELVDELRAIVMAEIEKIAAEGPLTEDIENHREFMVKNWQNSLEKNASWTNYIHMLYDSKLDYIADYERTIKELTPADVQATAQKILKDGNLVQVVMYPDK